MGGGDSPTTSRTDTFARRSTKSVVSGTVGGVVVCLVGHPFDTLKVRLQTQSATNPVYSGFLDSLVKTIKWEGVGGLYKGVGSPLVGQMTFKAVMFLSFNQGMTTLAEKTTLEHIPRAFIAGAVAGLFVSAVESPIDLFKTKMQCQFIQCRPGEGSKYRNVFHCGMVIAKDHGVRGLYQGLSATLIRNVMSVSLLLGTFEVWSRLLSKPDGKGGSILPTERLVLAGGLAGFCFWGFNYPTDVIKSSMQSDALIHGERTYKSWLQCASGLYKQGGWKRFYKGYTPCVLRGFIANAGLFPTVKYMNILLNDLEAKWMLP